MDTVFRLEQSSKAYLSIEVTESGMVIEVSFLHSENASVQMVTTVFGMV